LNVPSFNVYEYAFKTRDSDLTLQAQLKDYVEIISSVLLAKSSLKGRIHFSYENIK
jgi:hypothetical protein